VAAVKFREPFDRLSAPLVETDVPSHAGCGLLCAGWLACYRLARRECRRSPAYRGKGNCVTCHRETKLV